MRSRVLAPKTTYLRGVCGSVLGTIETSSVTKGQTDRITRTGQVVGFYDPRLDSTHRVTGQLFGFGNLLAYLVIAGDARR